jgi:hypothetical protein
MSRRYRLDVNASSDVSNSFNRGLHLGEITARLTIVWAAICGAFAAGSGAHYGRPVRALTLLACFSIVCFAGRARAQSAGWLTLESAGDCSISAGVLARRVNEALVGARDAGLLASVGITHRAEGYEVTLQTTSADATPATKVVSAPDCDEAIETAVVVLALALGRPATTEIAARGAAESAPMDPIAPAAPRWVAPAVEPRADNAPLRDSAARSRSRAGGLGLELSTGIDGGTLPTSTAYVAAGLRHALGNVELRSVVHYGLPYVEEIESHAASRRTERDFTTLELGACYGFGVALRFAGCAGGELGVLRSQHSVSESGRATRETDELHSRFAAVLTGLLAHRGGVIEPELELSALAGGAAGLHFAARAGVGAVVRF